jgi:hypothetical protein
MIESLLKPLKKIFFREMLSSSGGSTIVIDKDSAIQKFKSSAVSTRIVFYISKLRPVRIHILFRKGYGPDKLVLLDRFLNYNPFTYIPSVREYDLSTQTIVWTLIKPLNLNPSVLLSEQFLNKNYLKICYDISKALYSLKVIGIIHNDTRLDNVGILDGNFVLFDFDGAGTPDSKCKDYIDDYSDLLKSFKFYNVVLPEEIEGFTGIYSLVEIVQKLGLRDTLNSSLDYLENLTIVF